MEMVFADFTRVEGITVNEFRKQKVGFEKFPMVIFTNRTAVDHYFRLAAETRFTVPDSMRYFCLTEPIALYLQKYTVYRKRKVFCSPDGTLEGLIPAMSKYADERFLLPCSRTSKPDVVRSLRKANFKVTRSAMYETVSNPLQELPINSFDLIVLYSPFGVQALMDSFPDYEQGDTLIAALGRNTHYAVRKHNLKLDIAVPSAKFKSIIEALEHCIMPSDGE